METGSDYPAFLHAGHQCLRDFAGDGTDGAAPVRSEAWPSGGGYSHPAAFAVAGAGMPVRTDDRREAIQDHPGLRATKAFVPDHSRRRRHRDGAPAVRAETTQEILGLAPGYDAIRAVDSQHLRAARALLGWAMSDLAAVSGLSLSTIRRLEQGARSVSLRNHQAAVDALRAGGIRFLVLDDGTMALAEIGRASP